MDHEIIARTQERTYVLPHPALRTAISHYTLFRPRNRPRTAPAGERQPLHILPDASGCIVCESGPSGPALRYWGPTSKMVSVDHGTPALSWMPPVMLFVEFLPGGANRLFGMPMLPWQDRKTALDNVDAGLYRSISEAFRPSCDAFLHALNGIFLARIGKNRTQPLAAHLPSAIRESRGMARIRELTRATGYSERHLNRVVSDAVGLNIKLFSRIIRINNVCRALSVPSPELPLTALAQRFEYHDQAHFIHDFKAVCGITPGKYRAAVSHFYNEEFKLIGTIPAV